MVWIASRVLAFVCIFFFNDTATTEIYTLSLHDALPISPPWTSRARSSRAARPMSRCAAVRSEEHTSEVQSPDQLVCRLPLEKKKAKTLAAGPEITDARRRQGRASRHAR